MLIRDRPFAALCGALSSDPKPFRSLAPRLDLAEWDAFIALANGHFVTPAVYLNLSRHDLLGHVPDEARDFLSAVHDLNAARNRGIAEQVRELNAAFVDDGLDGVLLKGACDFVRPADLAIGERIVSDIDILIRREDTDTVREVLARLGYERRNDWPEPRIEGNYLRADAPAQIDVHYEVLKEDALFPTAEVWRSSSSDGSGAGLRIPNLTHRAMHLVLHEGLHHRGHYQPDLSLRAVHDTATFLARHGSLVDWGALCAALEQLGFRPMMEAQFHAAYRLLGAPWPLPHPPRLRTRLGLALGLLAQRHALGNAVAWMLGEVTERLAWHRMKGLYGRNGGTSWRWRAYHLGRFALKKISVQGR